MQSFPRQLFNLLFWLAAAGAGYVLVYPMRTVIDAQVRELVGAFAVPVYIVAGLVAGMALMYLNNAIAHTFVSVRDWATGSSAINYESGDFSGKLVRTARKLERKGDFIGAAETFETLEMWVEAGECYEKASQLSRGAQCMLRAGEPERAIYLYETEENYEMAAVTAANEGMRERATNNYRRAGAHAEETNRFIQAADFYEKGQDYAKAARVYEALKRTEDALRCYSRANMPDKIEELIQQIDPMRLIARGEAGEELVRRAAEVLARSGNPRKAGELLEAAQDFVRAAEFYELARDHEAAGECYLKAGHPDRGVEAYSAVADPAKRADYLGRVAVVRGDWAEAGRHFVDAGKTTQAIDAFKRAKDFEAAAGVYMDMKRFLLAAEMFSLAKNIPAAADAYAKGHDWRNAADCYETAGDHRQAMECYVSTGDFSRAGRIALKLEDFPKAIEFLQRVPPTAPDWRVATGFLASAFYLQRRIDMARELFEKVINNIAPSQETLPIFYNYARLLEEEDTEASISMYRRIQAVNLSFEDVGERIDQLQKLPPRPRTPFMDASQGMGPSYTPAPAFGLPDPGPVGGGWVPPPQTMQPPLWPRSPMPSRHPSRGSTVHMGASTRSGETRRPMTQAPETNFGDEGRYRILEELGRGGMAIVYRALDQHLEREVALKTFPLARPDRAGQEEMFLREARLIARLSHPNIVTIYDTGHMDYLYYIAMEYVQGEDLKALVKRRGPLGLDEVRSVFTQLADALHYAHSQNVLHRDIKPGNVIQRDAGDIKVVDFGLAKILSEAAMESVYSEDSQHTLVGTPQYMSPEQILGNPIDPRSDIYALGLTLFFVLTGRTPFDVKKVNDPLEISRMQVHSSFPRPSTLRATLPRKLDDVFVRCTQKNPDDRYASAHEFLMDFEGL